jgi:hypothetical protein
MIARAYVTTPLTESQYQAQVRDCKLSQESIVQTLERELEKCCSGGRVCGQRCMDNAYARYDRAQAEINARFDRLEERLPL